MYHYTDGGLHNVWLCILHQNMIHRRQVIVMILGKVQLIFAELVLRIIALLDLIMRMALICMA